MNFIPGGAIAKRTLGALGGVAAQLPEASKLLQRIGERVYKTSTAVEWQRYVDSGELGFVERLAGDADLARKLDSADATSYMVEKCASIDKQLGDRYWDALKATDAATVEAQKLVEVFGEADERTIALLETGGKVAGQGLETAMDGALATIRAGHSPSKLAKVLNNKNIDTPNHNRVDLFSDLGKRDASSGVPIIEKPGAGKALNRLQPSNNYVKGWKCELMVAVDLQEQGYEIIELGKLTPFSLPKRGGGAGLYTDLDVYCRKNGEVFDVQVKSSTFALNGGSRDFTHTDAANKMFNWIGAAKKADGKGAVRFAAPVGVKPGSGIEDVLTRHGLDWNSRVISRPTM